MPNIERKEELDIKSQNQQNWKKYINDLALNNYNYFVYNLKLKTNEREKNFKIIHREILKTCFKKLLKPGLRIHAPFKRSNKGFFICKVIMGRIY